MARKKGTIPISTLPRVQKQTNPRSLYCSAIYFFLGNTQNLQLKIT
jgi:hypothetical protein